MAERHPSRGHHQHLQAYLNEFTFRFNRRFYPFNAFRSLLGIAGDVTAPTYAELYSGAWQHLHVGGVGNNRIGKVRPFTGSIVISHGPPIARIGAAAEQAGLFALAEAAEEAEEWPELPIDPRLAMTLGLGLVAVWQLLRGQIFPPAVTAAWYAAHLAGWSAFDDMHDDGE